MPLPCTTTKKNPAKPILLLTIVAIPHMVDKACSQVHQYSFSTFKAS